MLFFGRIGWSVRLVAWRWLPSVWRLLRAARRLVLRPGTEILSLYVATLTIDRPGASFMPAPTPKTPCKRGRPAMMWLTLGEVAERLGFDSCEPLTRLLSFFPGAFPGAEQDDVHGWIVPSTTLSALRRPRVGIELLQEATVQEVAESIRRSPQTVWRWCQKGPHGEPAVLKSRKAAGTLLIDVRSVLSLPAKLPAWLTDAVKQSRMVSVSRKVSPEAALAVEAADLLSGPRSLNGARDSQCTGTTHEAQ